MLCELRDSSKRCFKNRDRANHNSRSRNLTNGTLIGAGIVWIGLATDPGGDDFPRNCHGRGNQGRYWLSRRCWIEENSSVL